MTKSSLQAKPQFSNRHLFLQIYDHFVDLIASGEWPVDRPIDSESDLGVALGCSPGTVRKALDKLEAEGLVTRRQGRGTFITDQCSDALVMRFTNLRINNGQRVTGLIESYECQVELANADEKPRLRLCDVDRVFRCVRLRQLNGRRFMYETVVISQRLMPGLTQEDFSNPRVGSVGARRHNMLVGKADERLSIALADSAVAHALGVAVNEPLLRLDRVIYSLNGKPLEWRVALCHLHDEYYMVDML
jgi:GntR family transcriptional regulator